MPQVVYAVHTLHVRVLWLPFSENSLIIRVQYASVKKERIQYAIRTKKVENVPLEK
jgi:hypothetical protein